MPSAAFTNHLLPLLRDAEDLESAYAQLRRDPAVQYGLEALSRAAVVMCVSAWEAFIEELVREAITALRPTGPAMGVWPALNASARGAIGRFNTPNTDQVRGLISDTLGLQDVQNYWSWQNYNSGQARERLQRAMEYRHQIAHGVNPRPVIDSYYTSLLPNFFRRLGRCTDRVVRRYLVDTLGIPNPWPE